MGQQVAFADKILLNKVDLVNEAEKTKLKARLKTINNFASIIETQKSRAPLENFGFKYLQHGEHIKLRSQFLRKSGREQAQFGIGAKRWHTISREFARAVVQHVHDGPLTGTRRGYLSQQGFVELSRTGEYEIRFSG